MFMKIYLINEFHVHYLYSMNGRIVVNTEFGCGKKELYCPSACLQKLRATGSNLRQDDQLLNQASDPGPCKYFALMATKNSMIFGNSCCIIQTLLLDKMLVTMLPLLQ